MGEDGARGKDWLRARGHHLCLIGTNFLVFSSFSCVEIIELILRHLKMITVCNHIKSLFWSNELVVLISLNLYNWGFPLLFHIYLFIYLLYFLS